MCLGLLSCARRSPFENGTDFGVDFPHGITKPSSDLAASLPDLAVGPLFLDVEIENLVREPLRFGLVLPICL